MPDRDASRPCHTKKGRGLCGFFRSRVFRTLVVLSALCISHLLLFCTLRELEGSRLRGWLSLSLSLSLSLEVFVLQFQRILLLLLFLHFQLELPVQIFFCKSIAVESICYRTKAKRLINKSNTTGGLNFFGQLVIRGWLALMLPLSWIE